jgi:hypothetical protein
MHFEAVEKAQIILEYERQPKVSAVDLENRSRCHSPDKQVSLPQWSSAIEFEGIFGRNCENRKTRARTDSSAARVLTEA